MKKLILVFLLLPTALWAQPSLDQILENQKKSLTQKNYSEVILQSHKIGELPSHADSLKAAQIYTNTAEAYLADEGLKLAIDYAERILKDFAANDAISELTLAQVYGILGRAYKRRNYFPEAEEYFKKEFTIVNAHPEYENEFILYSLHSYGRVLQSLVKYNEAVKIFQRALEYSQKPHLQADMMTVVCRNSLGEIYISQGKLSKAEDTYLKILIDYDSLLTQNNFTVSRTLNDLADLYMNEQKYVLAENYLLMYADIIEQTFDSISSENAYRLFFMGRLYSEMGQYRKADSLLQRCLSVRKILTDVSPVQMSHTFFRLGTNAHLMKQYQRAERYLSESLALREKWLGPYHPNVFKNLVYLADNYCALGNDSLALDYYNRGAEARHGFLSYIFTTASENQKLSFVSFYPPINSAFLTFAGYHSDSATIASAYRMVLNSKNMVINELMAQKEITFCNFDSALTDLYDKRNEARTSISNLILRNDYQSADTINYWINRQDSLEADLSQACSVFRETMRQNNYTLSDIRKALPDNSVLFDYIRYQPTDINNPELDQPDIYSAFMIDKKNRFQFIPLGEADKIDSLIFAYRQLSDEAIDEFYFGDINANEKELNKIGQKLSKLVFEPLAKRINANSRIYIAPDGMLNLLPFHTLVEHDKYLIEKYDICYLTSALDLLSDEEKSTGLKEAVIFSDPDYDSGLSGLVEPEDHLLNRVNGCYETEFPRLRYGHQEALELSDLLNQTHEFEVTMFDGQNATEQALKALASPPYLLHIITHGYYCRSGNDQFSNPLLNSSLIFAGVNSTIHNRQPESGSEDGILSAYEISGINLNGCELVALSACETGIGELSHDHTRQHEGVFGLRRAFRHAGAKSILLSLWKVPDKQTYELMNNFYQLWLKGKSKSNSIRQAMLTTLKESTIKHKSTHPIFWGGFMLLGIPD